MSGSMEHELVVASSRTDVKIRCWNLATGAEQGNFKSCASPPHGLVSVDGRFLVSSHVVGTRSSLGSVRCWSWFQPHVEVKSFPAECINPLACNSSGTYLVGGGVSGDMYLWEVATGRLLKKWHAHVRDVTCLVFVNWSCLVSGSTDGSIRVWNLLRILDARMEDVENLYDHDFFGHTLPVTDIVVSYGAHHIIVSASEDRTCKVWSMYLGKLLGSIGFPSNINAVALDQGKHVFYAGGGDGKIYIADLSYCGNPSSRSGLQIIDRMSHHSTSITCLALSLDGVRLVSGSEDGVVRIWNVETRDIIRFFTHAKAPVSNVLVVRQLQSERRHVSLLLPSLKSSLLSDEDCEMEYPYTDYRVNHECVPHALGFNSSMLSKQITELQRQGSSAASEMDLERLKQECKRQKHVAQQWKAMYENLYELCVEDFFKGEVDGANG